MECASVLLKHSSSSAHVDLRFRASLPLAKKQPQKSNFSNVVGMKVKVSEWVLQGSPRRNLKTNFMKPSSQFIQVQFKYTLQIHFIPCMFKYFTVMLQVRLFFMLFSKKKFDYINRTFFPLRYLKKA